MFVKRRKRAADGPSATSVTPLNTERWTEQQLQAAFLDHLERRRSSLDAFMWQAPALTIAGQAFLLRVLTDKTVDHVTLKWVLYAGVAASVAAIFALLRLRAREVLYSEAIAYHGQQYGMPDPRPGPLKRDLRGKQSRPGWDLWAWLDRPVRWFFGRNFLPITYWLWIAALGLFVVADIVAYRHTI